MSCPGLVAGEHLTIRTLDISSVLLGSGPGEVRRLRVLFVGNDWAEDHHDVEIVDEQGRRLARKRMPDGLAGITGLHALIAQVFPEEWAGTSPITRASGKQRVVLARYARNTRLANAAQQWAFGSLKGSPGARAYYDALRARNIGHQAALRQLANRLVGILHGCLKTATLYEETTAWAHHLTAAA
jgi:hypothetical protein